MAYPNLVAFDLDGTLWGGSLQPTRSYRDHGNSPSRNLKRHKNLILNKRTQETLVSNPKDVPKIFDDLRENGVTMFVVSRHEDVEFCIAAMKLMSRFSSLRKSKSYEIYNTFSKQTHFESIQRRSDFPYSQMLFFDDQEKHSDVELWQGVTFQKVSNRNVGITIADYNAGLDLWRRNQNIRRPMPGPGLDPHPNRRQIGWVGTDRLTGELYRQGQRRPRSTRPSRWGWGLYVADDPQVAAAFAQYQREQTPEDQYICRVFVRDFEVFKQMDKVWVPEDGSVPMTDVSLGDDRVAESQAHRDKLIAQNFAARKPYILFSRHAWTDVLFQTWRFQQRGRFSEMVVYPQIQDALFYAEPLQLSTFKASAEWQSGSVLGFDFRHQLSNWGIKWNATTLADFQRYSETVA